MQLARVITTCSFAAAAAWGAAEGDRALPLMADLIPEGESAPLPWGVRLTGVAMEQDFEVTDLGVDLYGTGSAMDLTQLITKDIDTEDHNLTLRTDAWLLPFLNLYGIVGWTGGEAEAEIFVPPGMLPGFPFGALAFDLEYDGLTLGAGATLAGARGPIFGSLDVNYTFTWLDVSDSEIAAVTLAPRVGYSHRGAQRFSAWVGAMFQHTDKRVEGEYPLFGSAGVTFVVDQQSVDPWNLLVGMDWSPTPHWEFSLEVGFMGREQVIASVGYRF